MGDPQKIALLVEENGICRDEIVCCLTQEGYRVKVVRTIREASSLLRQGIDLLVTNLTLPDGSGEDLIEQAQRYAIRNVGITADLRRLERLKMIDAPGVLTDPFQARVFVDVLRRTAGRTQP